MESVKRLEEQLIANKQIISNDTIGAENHARNMENIPGEEVCRAFFFCTLYFFFI